jgi:N-acetylglucosaminyldiphosphoundecaprenol N-acetyl-beta-D-mannosaminyltransferase
MKRAGAAVLGTFVDALDWQGVMDRISGWAARRESRCVCCANVHSVVTAARDADFKDALAVADMTTADGAPIAWMLRRLGFPHQERINGPDLMWKYCAAAATNGSSIFLYGSSAETLAVLQNRLLAAFPGLGILGTLSPPYRPLTPEEDLHIVNTINASDAGVVFVSLGCPKQELWMAGHRGRIRAVMIGVGAAFDYHGGTLRRAPVWIRNAGLEWLYRLGAEPRRLWKRYLVTNTLFVLGAIRQLICSRKNSCR